MSALTSTSNHDRASVDQTRSDRPVKIDRLRAIIASENAPGLVLSSAESLAWLFDGARVAVPVGGPAVLSAAVSSDGDVLVTAPANERGRLATEEISGEVEIAEAPWFEPLGRVPSGWIAEADVLAQLRAVRASLLPQELERYSLLGADVSRTVTAVLSAARPTDTERELASALAGAVTSLGADIVVLLVAGAERVRVQHPLPTVNVLGRQAMVAVGARRHGLIANLTRWISFGQTDDSTSARLRDVEADAFAATVPGRPLKVVLGDIAGAYARHGFGDEAWLAHHQGGPTGYVGRDPKVTPASDDLVSDAQAFAWNPWVPGAKLEDTVVIASGDVRVLTTDAAWPTVEVAGLPRPLTMEIG